jgi:hypothetical protein
MEPYTTTADRLDRGDVVELEGGTRFTVRLARSRKGDGTTLIRYRTHGRGKGMTQLEAAQLEDEEMRVPSDTQYRVVQTLPTSYGPRRSMYGAH